MSCSAFASSSSKTLHTRSTCDTGTSSCLCSETSAKPVRSVAFRCPFCSGSQSITSGKSTDSGLTSCCYSVTVQTRSSRDDHNLSDFNVLTTAYSIHSSSKRSYTRLYGSSYGIVSSSQAGGQYTQCSYHLMNGCGKRFEG